MPTSSFSTQPFEIKIPQYMNKIYPPLTVFSDIVLKLSRLFPTDALTDRALCYEQSLILLSYERVNQLSLHNILEPGFSEHPVLKRTPVRVPS